MRLKFLMAAMLLAAMGPGKSEPPPAVPEPVTEAAPAPAAPAPEPAPRAELPIMAPNDAAPGDFLWKQRLVVVFADTPDDPNFTQQMRMLTDGAQPLIDRDVVVIADSDPSLDSDWRDTLYPRGFSLVLIDKDGQVKLRKPLPWSVREISRAIDKFPLRRQEIGRGDLGQ